jgi:hypothetical protein
MSALAPKPILWQAKPIAINRYTFCISTNIQAIFISYHLERAMNIFALFHNKPKPVKQSAPRFNITEAMPQKIDFEVAEISYEEYQNAIAYYGYLDRSKRSIVTSCA